MISDVLKPAVVLKLLRQTRVFLCISVSEEVIVRPLLRHTSLHASVFVCLQLWIYVPMRTEC